MAQNKNAAVEAEDSESAKTKPTKVLPTDRLIFAKQLDLLRAYAVVSAYGSKPVRTTDVAAFSKIALTTVYVVNPFFVDIGLLTKSDAGFLPSAEVINYTRAYEWNPDTASRKLAPRMETTWFASKLLQQITYGQKLTEAEAVQDLAGEASAGPTYESQIKFLIEYLIAAGVVQRDGEYLKRLAPSAVPTVEQQGIVTEPRERESQQPRRTEVTTAFSQQPTQGVVQFHVSVKVDMAEFAGWNPERITAFFSGIAAVLAAKGAIEKEAGAG